MGERSLPAYLDVSFCGFVMCCDMCRLNILGDCDVVLLFFLEERCSGYANIDGQEINGKISTGVTSSDTVQLSGQMIQPEEFGESVGIVTSLTDSLALSENENI